jgi:hypothetical protein
MITFYTLFEEDLINNSKERVIKFNTIIIIDAGK